MRAWEATRFWAIRSSRAGSESFVSEIRKAVWSVNPDLPLDRIRTMEQIYRGSMARSSFTLVMLAIAGAMALLLGIEKFMSECRALTNVVGNGVATLVVSRWQGELDVEKMRRAMEKPPETSEPDAA